METAEMNVQIEEVGPCKKRLKIEVPKEHIETEWKKRFEEICRMAEIPGFRKGRAPKKLVEKRFGEQIKDDVKQSIVSDSYQKAIEENDINPIGMPEFSDIMDFSPENPLNFEVVLEVKPTFNIENYKGIKLIKKSATVEEKDIETALNQVAKQKEQLIVLEDGKIDHGDHIICDCQIDVEGSGVIWEDGNIEMMAFRPYITGVDTPGLASELHGRSSGEQCRSLVKLLADFPVEQYRGKSANITLTINEIKRPRAPVVDDELAKQLDFDSLDDLKKHLRERMEQDKKVWSQKNLLSQLYAKLMEMVSFDLPEDLIEQQAEKNLQRHQLELLRKGTSVDKIQKEAENLRNASKEAVIQDVKLSLIFEQIAEKERLYATETDVENRIAEMANAYQTTPVKLRSQFEKEGQISTLRNGIREDKVIEELMKSAVIEDEKPKEDNDSSEQQAKGAAESDIITK